MPLPRAQTARHRAPPPLQTFISLMKTGHFLSHRPASVYSTQPPPPSAPRAPPPATGSSCQRRRWKETASTRRCLNRRRRKDGRGASFFFPFPSVCVSASRGAHTPTPLPDSPPPEMWPPSPVTLAMLAEQAECAPVVGRDLPAASQLAAELLVAPQRWEGGGRGRG